MSGVKRYDELTALERAQLRARVLWWAWFAAAIFLTL
jgi:hypothetical protein